MKFAVAHNISAFKFMKLLDDYENELFDLVHKASHK